MNFHFLFTDYEDFTKAIQNYFYHKKENASLMEYLSSVESLTKEYLDKESAGPSTSNEPSPNSNTSKDDECSSTNPKTRIKDYDDTPCFGNDCSEDNIDTEKKGRLEWGIYMSRKLLSIYKENADTLQTTRNKKKVWDDIAAALRQETSSNINITGEQAREKFYTLKRGYRKYVSESNKSGNKRPRPLLLEKEMEEILAKDPTFAPVAARGSLTKPGTQDSDEEEDEESQVNTTPPPEKRRKKNKTEELRKILEERDDKFLNTLREMQESQNAVLNKIIEKLS